MILNQSVTRLSAPLPKLNQFNSEWLYKWFTHLAKSLWGIRFPCSYSFSKHGSSLNASTVVVYQCLQKHPTYHLELLLGPLAASPISNKIRGGTNIRKTALLLGLIPVSYIWQLNLLKLPCSRAFGAPVNHEPMPDTPGTSMGKTPFSSLRRAVGKLYPAPWQSRTWIEKST